jgi:mRNA interferase MazF
VGHELKKTRPAVVISPDELNESLDTVIVAPMTTSATPAPFRVPLVFNGKKGLVLTDQIRTVDSQRLVRKLGRIAGKTLALTLHILQEMFIE